MSRSPHMFDLAGPPPEVLAEVDAAWERAQELFDGALALHFDVDPVTRRVHGELRSEDGETVEHVSASEALAMACGDQLPRVLVAA